ncbi:MAG: Asp-tRNA(Asn)/Glu-tRNA(Gln) amidotransferase subunit GatB [Gemmatimonadetes bacterium]|nr:MAG: Asp-tRNA(Asn)/Glu-tRNA(Gln) amidotransferase subunit GatB [Gemmatimonadota bacterium]
MFARKNYLYPDLPRGYQISQFEAPLATDGRLRVTGPERSVEARIRRLHLEDDAGKSLHDRFADATGVDLNRAGTPLAEIVTEPDFRDPGDVRLWLGGLKRLLQYCEVSDCSMEEGRLRVDANVSLRPVGAKALGTKTEVKNLNSFAAVERALSVEIERQRALLDAGGEVRQATLLWDEADGTVRPMRSKEESQDYRYFPDPDLPPLVLEPAWIEEERARLPELPEARRERYVRALALEWRLADQLTADRAEADAFEALIAAGLTPSEAANWHVGPLRELANRRGVSPAELGVAPQRVAELVALVSEGLLSHQGARAVLAHLVEEGDADPRQVADTLGLVQVRDDATLEGWVAAVLDEHSDEVRRYRDGEERLMGYFVGQVMRKSGGAADPKRVASLLRARLGSHPG